MGGPTSGNLKVTVEEKNLNFGPQIHDAAKPLRDESPDRTESITYSSSTVDIFAHAGKFGIPVFLG